MDQKLYQKFFIMSKKGDPVLHVKLNRAIYGLLKSVLLFYNKLVSELTEYGFEINLYDPCVANKTINGSQMAVAWHVDNLKVSHVGPMENIKFILYLSKTYGSKITTTCGKVHDYLGVDLEYSEEGTVRILMIKYTKKSLEISPEAITTTSKIPAAEHLFQIQEKRC